MAQSGRSEIEHSYKADSNLAAEGVLYAAQLHKFIGEKRREKKLARQKDNPTHRQKSLKVSMGWILASRKLISSSMLTGLDEREEKVSGDYTAVCGDRLSRAAIYSDDRDQPVRVYPRAL